MDRKLSTLFKMQLEKEDFSFELIDLSTLDERLDDNFNRLENLNLEIDRLTNKSDNLDVWASIASGLITGVLDIFFVGELNFDINNGDKGESSNSGNEIINKIVNKVASWTGYKGPNDLNKVVEHLENKFPIDSDDAYRRPGDWISSHSLHHLEDLCHHPTPAGLLAALCVALFRVAIFSNKDAKTTFVKVLTNKEDVSKTVLYWSAIVLSGLLYWMSCALCKKYTNRELSELARWQRVLIKFVASIPAISVMGDIAFRWAGHLISDMAGSKKTAGAGMGIPGLFLSLMKELSMFPPFNSTNISEIIQRLYNKERTDLRDELIPVAKHLGKQAIPVILNEVLISSFYFVRRLKHEYHRNNGWHNIDWGKTIPFFNRTIVRMRTISSGVFVAVDAIGASLETAIKHQAVNVSTFILRMALKMNIVGIGQFVIDLGKDGSMALRKKKMEKIRSKVMMERIFLLGAKVYVRKDNLLVEEKDLDEALDFLSKDADFAVGQVCDNWNSVAKDFSQTNERLTEYRKLNRDFNQAIDLYL